MIHPRLQCCPITQLNTMNCPYIFAKVDEAIVNEEKIEALIKGQDDFLALLGVK